jgi:hypothetical protein
MARRRTPILGAARGPLVLEDLGQQLRALDDRNWTRARERVGAGSVVLASPD